MGGVILYGLLVGLDNLQVAAGLGTLGLSRRERGLLAVMFGLLEGLMPLVGLLIGTSIAASAGEAAAWVGPLLLLAAGLAVIVMSLRGVEPAAARRPWMLLVLPLSLSIDNLMAGVGLGAMGLPVAASAAIVGLLSAGMCLAGLALGHRVRGLLRGRADLLSGAALIGVAVLLMLLEG